STMGTALIYDEEMTKYKLLWVDPACKIEVPERLSVSYQALVRTGLSDRCVAVPPREASDAEILLVHSEEYLEGVKKTPHMTLEDLKEFTLQYGDVYFHPNIYHCAKLAAGSALQLVDSVMTGTVRNGMALVRPPGHHSMRSAASGFCVFNNVAIAARYAKQKHGAKRVLIVDWDIHHGQGVQYCFEDDPSVLYFSWHRYEHQKFWPNLRESDYDSVGKGSGAGFNINVPWNKVCSSINLNDYLSAFCHVLLPVAYEFCPDLVLVCAGFDSAVGDPEGEMCATPDIFAHLTHLLMNLAGGKLCAVLEGGYNLTSLAQSVCQTVQTLLGDPLPRLANLGSPCERSGQTQTERCRKSRNVFLLPGNYALLRPYLSHEMKTSVEFAATGNSDLSPTALFTKALQKRLSAGIPILLRKKISVLRKMLVVQISGEDKEEQKCKYYIPMCLKKGCGDTVGFIQAVLGLLLPLGYEYDPGLVLLSRMPGSGVGDCTWQQLIGLLKGFAKGHTLVLMQTNDGACMGPTASVLLGHPAPPLQELLTRLPDDGDALERMRERLQADWKMLETLFFLHGMLGG
uniref:Histone deacetylase domain-containing protein n=1 Tax=Xiphophorus couchianus TaxID=32473 RepID=A0A3B5MVZ3_9TELE